MPPTTCKLTTSLILLISSLLVSSGCVRKYSIAEPEPPAVQISDYTSTIYGADLKIYEGASTSDDGRKTVRNKIVKSLEGCIDEVFGEYVTHLYLTKGAEAISFDTLNLGLTAASTIATHTPTKTILSALGTGVAGAGLSVDKNLFAQQTFQVIAIAMQTRRDKIATAIDNNLKLSDADYPLAAAKRDLIAYYQAGTLAAGLQELQEEAGVNTAANARNSGKKKTPAQTETQGATPAANQSEPESQNQSERTAPELESTPH